MAVDTAVYARLGIASRQKQPNRARIECYEPSDFFYQQKRKGNPKIQTTSTGMTKSTYISSPKLSTYAVRTYRIKHPIFSVPNITKTLQTSDLYEQTASRKKGLMTRKRACTSRYSYACNTMNRYNIRQAAFDVFPGKHDNARCHPYIDQLGQRCASVPVCAATI